MIVYTKDDVVFLSGALTRNQWYTIKAAANLLLHEYPEGIIIDCSELTEVDEEGAQTLLDAIRDIDSAHARMMVTNIPESVQKQIDAIPGIKSQVALAASLEEARESLRGGGASLPTESPRSILVPLLDEVDVPSALEIASQVAMTENLEVVLVRFLEVDRNLPIGAPLPRKEQEARDLLEAAAEPAKKLNVKVSVHLERVREAREGLIQEVQHHDVAYIVMSGRPERFQDQDFLELVHVFLQRLPCNIIVGRPALR